MTIKNSTHLFTGPNNNNAYTHTTIGMYKYNSNNNKTYENEKDSTHLFMAAKQCQHIHNRTHKNIQKVQWQCTRYVQVQ